MRARNGSPAVSGSRRWKKIATSQKKADRRNRQRVGQGINRAARLGAEFVVANNASHIAIGDPRGVRAKDSGAVQNRRVSRWPMGYSARVLGFRLEEVGYVRPLEPGAEPWFCLIDERGTSSVCPSCGARATKNGRLLLCSSPTCRRRHHRDVAGAQNTAMRLAKQVLVDAPFGEIAHLEHRRVGSPARRDHRRARFEALRADNTFDVVLPVPGTPEATPQESHAFA